MKRLLRAFAMCQSMFCAIPCPWRVWDEAARPLMVLFLPVVGLELGALWALLAWGTARLSLPALVTGLLLCALPHLLSGFIHLDGFMDVTDAVRSCRDPARRREILKDPRAGSFAVIGCVLLLLAEFALFSAGCGDARALLLLPAVTRCCSGLAVTGLRPLSGSQYAGRQAHRGVLWTLFVLLALLLAAGFLCCGRYGFAPLLAAVGYGLALRRAVRALGGVNGDGAGYALCLGELCGVAACVFL